MARTALCMLLIPAALLVAACGGEDIDASTYTCGQFSKSLDTKDDRSAGTYIRLLNDRAKTKGERAVQEKRMAYSIYVACRGKKASFRPADEAVSNAKKIAAGKAVIPEDVKKRAEEAAREAEKEKAAE